MAGLYIHIPFCRQKCIYCDFCSYPDRNDMVAEYFACLKKELSACVGKESRQVEIDTVYFGGGTPSSVEASLLADLLEFVSKKCVLKTTAEITVECNPDSASESKISLLARSGVNRLSIGLQTADDDTLKLLNRPHNLAQFENTVECAAACGIGNVSADIILGLPDETSERLDKTLDVVVAAGLKHISAYGLSVERGTRLYGMVKGKGGISLPDEDMTADFYDQAYGRLLSAGFSRYEVSNFAVKGFECRHNINYWRCGEYIGLGASAHSYFHGVRRANIKNLDKYINALNNGKLPVASRDRLSEKEKAYEFIILGLRTEEGVDMDEYGLRFKDRAEEYICKAYELLKRGYLEARGSRLRIPSDKFYVLNSILCEI